MVAVIVVFCIGALTLALGIFNYHGNLSTLRAYHRRCASQEEKNPFERKQGPGMIVLGASIIVHGVFLTISIYTKMRVFFWCGIAVFVGGILAGIGLGVYGLVRYRKKSKKQGF